MGRENKKEAVAALHRERIMAAAEQLFAEKGYAQTTIEDISRNSAYSRRTIYAYFESKDDILHHIIEKGLLVLKEDIAGALTGDGDFLAKYRTICNAVRRYHRDCPQSVEHVNRARTESFEQTELPDAVKRILVLGTEINGLLTAFLEEGQAEGAVRWDIVPGMSVYVLYSGMTALLALAESKGEFIEKQFSLSGEEFLEYGFRQIISSMLVEKIDIR